MLTKLVLKLARPLGIKAALAWVRRAAEGQEGPAWRRRYEWLVGKKTSTALVLASVATVLVAFEQHDAARWVGVAAGFLFQAGILDRAWRGQRPTWLTESGLYRLLAAYPAEVASAFTLAVAWQQDECAGDWCRFAGYGLIALAATAVNLGLLDAAWKSPGPRVAPGRFSRFR